VLEAKERMDRQDELEAAIASILGADQVDGAMRDLRRLWARRQAESS
jgi:hypothetical protein